MSDKSTARPWRTKSGGNLPKQTILILADNPTFGVAKVQWQDAQDAEAAEANAELICKAVNQYDHVAELIEAAKGACRTIELSDLGSGPQSEATRLRSALDKMEVGQ